MHSLAPQRLLLYPDRSRIHMHDWLVASKALSRHPRNHLLRSPPPQLRLADGLLEGGSRTRLIDHDQMKDGRPDRDPSTPTEEGSHPLSEVHKDMTMGSLFHRVPQ